MSDGLLLFQVDAFTSAAYAGNPAAVCILEQEMSGEWMQAVSAEMNLSETAFLLLREKGYNLRWFTPVSEVDLCGHATLASAHVLWGENLLDHKTKARFFTRSGPLFAKFDPPWIELDFPAQPAGKCSDPGGLCVALGIAKPVFIGKSEADYLVEVNSEDTLVKLKPNFQRLAEFGARGVIVTARASSSGYDFVSRFFAPGLGIDEDPVTGSSHCTLGPYWQQKLGKDRMFALQASARGGELHVIPSGERVFLTGKAVTVLRGELLALDEPGGQ
ncbi:MAG: PhzF family phenazine biosynthesis protein [Candidatus Glassbacteria bacterium]|nr:PhzF family phenazine biosynthesis protein [Candidatus Glassbacteria bacterium]